jgi:hypothetical protein
LVVDAEVESRPSSPPCGRESDFLGLAKAKPLEIASEG